MINKSGSAKWNGGFKEGSGTVSTQSGVLDGVAYSAAKRFEGEAGTNPEELIGAAHASCFAMALSLILGEHGMTPQEIDATSTVSLEQKDGGFAITKAHLEVKVTMTGADEAAFMTAANAAKEGCPISKLLNAEITMDASLA